MTANGWFQILFFLLVILAVAKPLGVYMAESSVTKRPFSIRFSDPSRSCCIGSPAWTKRARCGGPSTP